MIHHFSNSASPFLPSTATESSSSSRPCMDAEMLNIGEYLLVDDLLEFSNDDIAGPIESTATTTAAALLEFPAMPSYDSSILLPSTVGGDVCSLTSSEGPEMDWLSSLHDEVEEEEDEQRIGSGVFKIGAKLSGRQFPASYTFNNNNNNNNNSNNHIISEDAWCVPALTQIVRAGSAGKAARSKRSRSSNYAGGWTGCSNNSGLLINSSESVADSRGSLDSDLLTDLSSTSNTFCQSEIINVNRPIIPLHNPASNCLPPSADRQKSSKKGRENKVDDSGRRCTHCQSQKTPQWRLGPAGPKTLCNACGVRFKSGRLFPEYRPAKSPTFISHRHSNSHRKVLEMRKHKGLPALVGIASSPARFKTGSISMESSWTIENSNIKLHKRKLASASSSDSSSVVVFQDDGHDDEYKNDADYNEEEDEEEEDDDDNDEEEEEEEETC